MDLDIQRQDDPESAQRDFLAATADDLDDYFVFSLVDMERRNEAEEGAQSGSTYAANWLVGCSMT